MGNKKKVYVLLFAAGIISLIYLKFHNSSILEVDHIPKVFGGISATEINSLDNFRVAHDEYALYILNGFGQDFESYKLDNKNEEIVIEQDIVGASTRGKHFQLIKIDKKILSLLVAKNRIKIRIHYLYLSGQYRLIEYNFENRKTRVIENRLVGK